MTDGARVILFTGDGKGKTTAALGLTARAAGHGMRVCFVQFVKDAGAPTGEAAFLKRADGVELIRAGLGRVPPPGDPGFDRHAAAAARGLEAAFDALKRGACELVVLDEVCVAARCGLLDTEGIRSLVALARRLRVHVVMTGRDASDELTAECDTVTEMRSLRHAFDAGRPAQKGIEL